jgi:hypothetical protein
MVQHDKLAYKTWIEMLIFTILVFSLLCTLPSPSQVYGYSSTEPSSFPYYVDHTVAHYKQSINTTSTQSEARAPQKIPMPWESRAGQHFDS